MDIIKTLAIAKPEPISGAGSNIKAPVLNIIDWFLGIVGIIALIVIIIGGVQYMTSTGDPGKVKKAKDTILYGIIGLIIVALAAVIVNFTINIATKQPASSYTTQSDCTDNNYTWDAKTKTCQ